MKKSLFLSCLITAFVVFTLAISGCLSIPNSPNPRFYMLKAMDKPEAGQTFPIPAGTIISIGPVDVPEYQNRQQIVTQDKNKMLNIAQFDRWGEQLNTGIMRILIENLTVLLPDADFELFPASFAIPVNYQVIVDIVQLESNLNGEVFFAAQWSIIRDNDRKMMFNKRYEARQPINPNKYSGLVKALSDICASFSKEIAKELSALSVPAAAKN